MIKIAISSDAPHFSQEHILFGHSYLLEFEWIERGQIWVLHIFDSQESPIALGLKVALELPLFIDRARSIIFWLTAKNPNASLDLLSFHKDFVLMVEAIDAAL